MNKNKRQVVIILGPPGSGKGTQASLISEKFGYYYLETSKILEQGFNNSDKENFLEADGKKYYFSEQKKKWEKGLLCDPPFVSNLVIKKIREVFAAGENLIFAGSPRTIYEAEKEIPLLAKLYGKKNIQVIDLRLSPEGTIFRNSRRRICRLMRHPIIYSKENEKLTMCPLDGSKLVSRGKLDKPATIKVRLKEYENRTKPLLAHIKKQGLKINNVDGEKTVEEVFKSVLKVLK